MVWVPVSLPESDGCFLPPPEFTAVYRHNPQHRAISKLARQTNHIERFNNTLRQRVSRLVRDALSFSKKLANPVGAIKLFICHYNLTRAVA